MPLAATLGDLHQAIQVLSDWDGDHLHAFTVAGHSYSDPLFDLEETADEEAVRLRDAFPASARKPVRYEYDFGASWVHEVTRTGSSRLAPGEIVPRCLSFSGDNPVDGPLRCQRRAGHLYRTGACHRPSSARMISSDFSARSGSDSKDAKNGRSRMP